MPDFGSGVRYGAQGAAVGTSIAPGIGTAIGGGIGFLAGLFGGGDDEEERQKRFQQFLRVLADEKRQRAMDVFKQTSGLTQQATAGAARRARAAGRDPEDYILPAQTAAIGASTEAMRTALQPYDEKRLGAEYEFAQRPMEPNTLDYLMEAGSALGGYLQNERVVKAIEQQGTGQLGTAIEGVPFEEVPTSTGIGGAGENFTSMGDISRHRKRDMGYNPLNDDNYLNSLYG